VRQSAGIVPPEEYSDAANLHYNMTRLVRLSASSPGSDGRFSGVALWYVTLSQRWSSTSDACK
jgi:hypothetical protein